MNKKGFMRTVEALLASVIMITAVSFIMSGGGVTFVPSPASEAIQAKDFTEDVLIILENDQIYGKGKLAYYISNRDQYSLENELKSIILPGYAYELKIFKLDNIEVIDTSGIAGDPDNDLTLTNGYKICSDMRDMNNKKIWHYYIDDMYNISCINIPLRILLSDIDENISGYDSVYISLDKDNDFTRTEFPASGEKFQWNLLNTIPLKVMDYFYITEIDTGYSIKYKFLIGDISQDGNSVSIILDEMILEIKESPLEIDDLFGEKYRFTIVDNRMRIECFEEGEWRKLYEKDKKEREFIGLYGYSGEIMKIDPDYASIKFCQYKNLIMDIKKGGKMKTSVVGNRIISVEEDNKMNFYFVSLVQGRIE